MKTNRPVLTLFLGCLSCGTLLAQDQANGDKVKLRLNLKTGELRDFNYAMDATSNVKVGEQTVSMKMNMGMQMAISTVDVDAAGNHALQFRYDRVKFRMSGGGIKMKYDSRTDDPDNPATKAFGAMVGTALTFHLAPNGEVIKIEGADELAKRLAINLPGGEDALKKQLENTKSQLGQIFATFPDKPVGIGDTWITMFETSPGPQMKMAVHATYTLAERRDGKAIIEVSGKISDMESGLSGNMSGSIRVDEATGWTEIGNLVMTIKGNVQGLAMDMSAKINFGDGKLKDSAER